MNIPNVSKEAIESILDNHRFTDNSAITTHELISLMYPKSLTVQDLLELLSQQNNHELVPQLGKPDFIYNNICLEGTGQKVTCEQLHIDLLSQIDKADLNKIVYLKTPSCRHFVIVGLCHGYWVMEPVVED